MRRVPAILDARGRVARIPQARYEGAFSSPTRSRVSELVQSAKRDVSSWPRRELMRKSRYLWKNSLTIRALVERLVTYTIGTGLHPTPKSSSDAFNKSARKAWRGWSKHADLQSRESFESLQRTIARSVFRDGDIGDLLTYGPSGRPRVQLLESHLITSGMLRADDPDGVSLDDFGRPDRYSYALDSSYYSTSYESVSADSLILHMLPERAAQYRGVTILAAAINSAHDVDDILALEKAAVKDASSKTDIIKTESGEADPDDFGGIGKSLRGGPDDSIEAEAQYYQRIFTPEAKVMKRGDEYTPYIPSRPSPAWTGFMDFLTNTICLSTGLPPSLLFGTKVGGADSRRELASAQRVIEVWQQEFAAQFQRVYEYVIAAEIAAGFFANVPGGVPEDWRETEWQCPAKLTVDAGRDAQNDREDIKAGTLTHEEYFSRWGQDWREELRQAALEAKYKKDLAAELGIEVSDFALRSSNELNNSQTKEKNGQG
jgi:capsid protein